MVVKIKGVNGILKEVLENVKPSKDEIKELSESVRPFLEQLKMAIKEEKITADVFVGGSYAKDTLIKKKEYDIDIFVRFDKKYKEKEEISDLTEKALRKIKEFPKTDIKRIHGSRDYFQIKRRKNILLEIIPVIKVSKPEHAVNITDLSYFHVNYVRKKLKNEKDKDEVRLAKAFCYFQNCYGAESYIKGFSGYGLELLMVHYKTFLNFIKAVSKVKTNTKEETNKECRENKEKIIIDLEKKFKNRNQILMDLNSSKLASPIILIDPTYKERNALAALSDETFEKLKKASVNFLKNPSKDFFENKEIDFNKLKERKLGKEEELIVIETETDRQEGDIAGSKLLKFFNFIEQQIEPLFLIKEKGFQYENGKKAKFFFYVKKKPEIGFDGPLVDDLRNAELFNRAHKKTFTKGSGKRKKLYALEANRESISSFIRKWKEKRKNQLKEMYIKELTILD